MKKSEENRLDNVSGNKLYPSIHTIQYDAPKDILFIKWHNDNCKQERQQWIIVLVD